MSGKVRPSSSHLCHRCWLLLAGALWHAPTFLARICPGSQISGAGHNAPTRGSTQRTDIITGHGWHSVPLGASLGSDTPPSLGTAQIVPPLPGEKQTTRVKNRRHAHCAHTTSNVPAGTCGNSACRLERPPWRERSCGGNGDDPIVGGPELTATLTPSSAGVLLMSEPSQCQKGHRVAP